MGKPFDHEYLNAGTSSVGDMICGACNKPITDGSYRAYKKTGGHDWRYVLNHRACCADDPAWEKRDKAAANHKVRLSDIAMDVRGLLAKYPVEYAGVIQEELNEQLTRADGGGK